MNGDTDRADLEGEDRRSKPYKDEELLRELYLEEQMSMIRIGEKLDCAPNTVKKYLKEHGIEIRDASEQMSISKGYGPYEVPFKLHHHGPEAWWLSTRDADQVKVYVHRLVAVAEYGFETVADSHIHHKNEIRWDNRPENLEPMDPGDHTRHHRQKIKDEERRKIADRYHNTDDSSYTIAEDYDVDPVTIMTIYREFYGEDNGGEKAT